ncbi:MAG: diguanylate cyclase [Desulfocapsa sp.]|jgi:diguanylate cyclase (GGDEF)-like protein/PAS domain S-box-containing protein|nr:diguanylate cyclase [Desulfocapsa sp.]MBU4237601.1 diguanylate cyclase [Pseudomonadota bacterium]
MNKEIIINTRSSFPKSSINREIFQSSALLALIVVAVFGLFLSTILYYSEISKAHTVINRTNRAVVFSIEGYFAEIMNTLMVLEENKEIREAMALDAEAHQRILDGYRSFSRSNKNIAFIYSGYENGLMLINNYTPPEGFDPTTRPWYRAAMAIKPETSVGLPYQEIKSKEWLVSTSRALKQSGGGYGGVVAIDCLIDQVVHLLAQHDEYKTEFSFVMDRSGKIIMHPDQVLLGKSLPEMKEAFQQDSNGDFTYRIDNVENFAHYSRSTSTGWTVVTVVEKREILHPIILQVLFLVSLTGVIAVLLGLAQSTLLSRRLSRPLVELDRKIKSIIAGDELYADEYVYPNNEIGIIAQEIGQLAEKELDAKTRALQASEETYKTILMASPDDITIADLSGCVIMVSEAANKMFGYDPEEGPGMSIMDFIFPEDHERARANMVKMLHGNYPGPNEYRAIRKDKSCFDIEVKSALIRDRQGNPFRMVLIARDITRRKKTEQQIQELVRQLEIERDLAQSNSLTDSLTGLSNRRFFDNALRAEFSRHKRSGSQFSLIMLDVDHFKKYNDHYGHLAGDDCLRQLAITLRTVVGRDLDIIARYGGEEFVIILPDTNRQGAAILAERIGEAMLKLALPHAKSDISEFVTISLGIATAADHILTDGSQLVALADQALYQAKKNGRNRYEVMPVTI